MFSGIVEAVAPILSVIQRDHVLGLKVRKPSDFSDIKIGDSIAVDGVCLTVEGQTEEALTFAVAAETLHVTQWKPETLMGREVNLERSLSLGARINGHLVTGHVDAIGQVVASERKGESLILQVSFPLFLNKYLWPKGSVALNGVSLTINQVIAETFSLCLIPETLKRTNLADLKIGTSVNIEIDNMARGFVRFCETSSQGASL